MNSTRNHATSAGDAETRSIIPAALLALVVIVVGRWIRRALAQRNDDVHRLQVPPGAHWIWGHEKEANFVRQSGTAYNEYHDNLKTPPNQEGPGVGAFRINGALWTGDLLVLHDPVAIQHVVARNVYTGKYAKSAVFRPMFARLVGKGLAWAEGEEHRRMAKVLLGTFNTERVREWMGVIDECSEKMISMLRTHVAAAQDSVSKDKDGVLMNMIGWPSRATLDIIGRIGFDHDFGCGETPEAQQIFHHWRSMGELGLNFSGFIAPLVLRAFPIIDYLIPMKVKEAQNATRLSIHTLAAELAKKEQALAAAGYSSATAKTGGPKRSTENGNLLSQIFRASMKDEGTVNMEELLDQISTFVIAGYETSASVIAYALLQLSTHPDVQAKLRDELDASDFGLEKGGKKPTFDELMDGRKLPYLDAVVKESIRTFVPAAQTEREALEDDIIPLSRPVLSSSGELISSIHVKKGQVCFISWQSVNTNPGTWGSDGEEWRPERWLEGKGDEEMPQAVLGGWNHMGTFSEGPRICIGYRLAVLEVKKLLFEYVNHFEFGAVTKAPLVDGSGEEEVKVKMTYSGLTQMYVPDGERMGMKGGWVPVRVKAREEHH